VLRSTYHVTKPATPEISERHKNKAFPGIKVVKKLIKLTAAQAASAKIGTPLPLTYAVRIDFVGLG
jgi:hypothetical protein